MKIILSRKGFDSGYGGYPSPVLPDGRLISLPIPSAGDKRKYSELNIDPFGSYYDLMIKLNPNIKDGHDKSALTSRTKCHLDPDIYKDVTKRPAAWKGSFGQISAAQSHLSNQNISKDDIFLFFGWFRKTKYDGGGRLIFDPADKTGRHIIYGFLQIGEIIRTACDKVPQWLKEHPHVIDTGRSCDKSNTLYIARDKFTLNTKIPGYGVFRCNQNIILTKQGMSRSCWKLPACFRAVPISYHDNRKYGWHSNYFLSAAKGQEFVIAASDAIMTWTRILIEKSM